MSFNDILPPATRRYKYEGYDQCLAIMEQESERLEREEDALGCAYNPYFIMDIDERSFLECFVNSGENLLTLSWEIYDYVSQSALLKMESSTHAVTIGAFNTIFSAWARRVDYPLLDPTTTGNVRGETRIKKADISWSPQNMPCRSAKWPTFVGEVAWSERRSKLQEDMKFWLDNSGSSVNAAITISLSRSKIMVESWERSDGSPPSPNQKIEILRQPRPGRPKVNGHLQIKFSDVFLREKRNGEIDFILTERDMNELARHIWGQDNRTTRKKQIGRT
ncbi:uncharacterized protein PGRI_066550 [Penicillium griseofulvum]|uniref:Uncharacterized protein n=1 Tax=Penicillium patulum TaxID=5078 RepID=A0A135LQ43_PENPA|nr:uncharacterized protein PGRI_066550 [Penicillium griseofulvum]KXG51083.1 hypothetical protein PGRI_066550 [Penicillium griseofulvum]